MTDQHPSPAEMSEQMRLAINATLHDGGFVGRLADEETVRSVRNGVLAMFGRSGIGDDLEDHLDITVTGDPKSGSLNVTIESKGPWGVLLLERWHRIMREAECST